MKFVMKSLLLVSMVCSSTLLAKGDATKRLSEARLRLELTEVQLKEIKPILQEDMAEKNQVLLNYGIDLKKKQRPQNRLTLRQARALGSDLDAVRESTVKKLSHFLNQKQINEYRKIQEENKQRMRERIRESR